MKYVKCLYNGSGEIYHENLTINKLYKVITYYGISIIIIDDNNEKVSFVMKTPYDVWFEDVTIEVRNSKINSILR